MKTQTISSGADAPPTFCKSGSEIIVDTLRQLGVEVVFGYLGSSLLPLFDHLYDQPAATAGFVPSPQAKAIGRCHKGT